MHETESVREADAAARGPVDGWAVVTPSRHCLQRVDLSTFNTSAARFL